MIRREEQGKIRPQDKGQQANKLDKKKKMQEFYKKTKIRRQNKDEQAKLDRKVKPIHKYIHCVMGSCLYVN